MQVARRGSVRTESQLLRVCVRSGITACSRHSWDSTGFLKSVFCEDACLRQGLCAHCSRAGRALELRCRQQRWFSAAIAAEVGGGSGLVEVGQESGERDEDDIAGPQTVAQDMDAMVPFDHLNQRRLLCKLQWTAQSCINERTLPLSHYFQSTEQQEASEPLDSPPRRMQA